MFCTPPNLIKTFKKTVVLVFFLTTHTAPNLTNAHRTWYWHQCGLTKNNQKNRKNRKHKYLFTRHLIAFDLCSVNLLALFFFSSSGATVAIAVCVIILILLLVVGIFICYKRKHTGVRYQAANFNAPPHAWMKKTILETFTTLFFLHLNFHINWPITGCERYVGFWSRES